MAIQDSNPERRNVLVTSLSIIVFFLAGGKFTDSTVRLQIVNVYFSNPEVLGYFIWGLLVWFVYRYWLIHQGSWKEEFYNEICSVPHILYDWHLTKKFGLNKDYSKSYYSDRHFLMFDSNYGTKITFKYVYKGETDEQKTENKKVNSLSDRFLILVCTVYVYFRRPSLSGYFIPYILFLWAIYLGIIEML